MNSVASRNPRGVALAPPLPPVNWASTTLSAIALPVETFLPAASSIRRLRVLVLFTGLERDRLVGAVLPDVQRRATLAHVDGDLVRLRAVARRCLTPAALASGLRVGTDAGPGGARPDARVATATAGAFALPSGPLARLIDLQARRGGLLGQQLPDALVLLQRPLRRLLGLVLDVLRLESRLGAAFLRGHQPRGIDADHQVAGPRARGQGRLGTRRPQVQAGDLLVLVRVRWRTEAGEHAPRALAPGLRDEDLVFVGERELRCRQVIRLVRIHRRGEVGLDGEELATRVEEVHRVATEDQAGGHRAAGDTPA